MSNPNVTKDRYKYVGGSDLPTILGYNVKYGTRPIDLALEKAGIVPTSFKGNQYTRYGQLMEPIIRDYINSITGANYLEDTVVDEVKGYRGNTDGIDRTAVIPILEIKTFGEVLDVEYYTAQCQFYMETFNQNSCLLVGYKRPNNFYMGVDYDLETNDTYFNIEFDPNNIEEIEIDRDPVLWSQIEERITAFKKGVEYLKEHRDDYTEEGFNSIFYGNELIVLADKVAILETKLEAYKSIEAEYKDVKEKLYKAFEDKGLISFETGNLKITKVAPTSYDTVSVDTKKLQEDEPTIYEKYKVTKTTNKKGYILIKIKEAGDV